MIAARIHSLNGDFDQVHLVSEHGPKDIVVLYKDKFCTAIYNIFAGCYYVDDVHGVIQEAEEDQEEERLNIWDDISDGGEL